MNNSVKIILGVVVLAVVIFIVFRFTGGDAALSERQISQEEAAITDLDEQLDAFFDTESALDEVESSLGGVTPAGSNPLDLGDIEDESKAVEFDSSFDEFFNVESGLDELDL